MGYELKVHESFVEDHRLVVYSKWIRRIVVDTSS